MNEEPKGFLDKQVDSAISGMQASWDKCSLCHKPLPPGTPTNKLYDDKLGSLTVCIDCSLKAIMWYARNQQGSR